MSNLFPNYGRQDFEIMSGKGCQVTDDQGRTYLDFTSGIGVMNLGYGNPLLEEALVKQSRELWHMPNLYQSHLQEEVAELLAAQHDFVAFFCNSGTEANEAAIKLARKATGRSKLITFLDSFHGRTYGGMSATGQEKIHEGFQPLVPGFTYLPYNQLAPLEEALDQDTAAVMLEVVQGEGGVLPAEKAWLQAVAELCKENGTLLIVDEVQTGIGRTGKLFAFEHFNIQPDIVTLAKGLGNGFPVGAMLGKRELTAAFGPGSHGSTFGGNKLAMAAAKSVLQQLDDDLLAHVATGSQQLLAALQEIDSPYLKEVRGLGLMIGLELTDELPVGTVISQLQAKGLLTLRAGANVLRLLPPLTVSIEEMMQAAAWIKEVIQEA